VRLALVVCTDLMRSVPLSSQSGFSLLRRSLSSPNRPLLYRKNINNTYTGIPPGTSWHKTCTINGMIIGIDISEKNNVTSWVEVAKNQVRFVYLKCTDGIAGTVATYAGNKKNAKQTGILTGAYHWLNPAQDAVVQAEHFIKNAAIVDDDLPPVVCLELYSTSKTVLEPKLRTFLETAETRIGKRPLVYTSATYWKKYMAGIEWPCEYPLWIDEPGVIWPAQLFPWAGWAIWQFSYQVKIPSVSGTPGLNWFNGSQADLQALANEGLVKR